MDFKIYPDKRSKSVTAIILTLVVAALVALVVFYRNGTYLPAWVVSLVAAFMLLVSLSIPRRISVGDAAVEIFCILDMSRIEWGDFRSVRVMEHRECRRLIPFAASCGFFGYYGRYYNLVDHTIVRMYARRRDNLVAITDCYGRCYVVSCESPSELATQIEKYAAQYHNLLDE